MFSELLKELRIQRNITQIELARSIGVSNGNVGDWERGRSKPGYDALAALSRYFEISPEYLLELSPKKESESSNDRQLIENLKKEQRLLCDGSPLESEEADLIAMFRLLPSYEREDLFDLIYFKYKKHVEKKMESVYWTYAAEKGKAKPTSAPGDDSQSINA